MRTWLRALTIVGLIVVTVQAEKIRVPKHYPTIQAGIDAAKDGDTVLVADGVYTGNGNRDIDFKGKLITVRGKHGPENCIINMEGAGVGFYFQNGETDDAVLDGFTVTNGRLGIDCVGSSPTIRNCIITGNGTAGGLLLRDSNAGITDCTITWNNAVGSGGGIHISGSSKVTISKTTVANNLAFGVGRRSPGVGGGIVIGQSSSLVISNCTIMRNRALGSKGPEKFDQGGNAYGGGLYFTGSSLTITNTTIANNTASGGGGGDEGYPGHGFGGGLYSTRNATITDCIITGNHATHEWGGSDYSAGGGLYLTTGAAITNCTITSNSAGNDWWYLLRRWHVADHPLHDYV